MKRVLFASVVFLAVIVSTGHAIAETPGVIKTTPHNGATDVAVDTSSKSGNIFLAPKFWLIPFFSAAAQIFE